MSRVLMNWKSTAAVSGVTLVAGWLGFTPARPASVVDGPAVSAARSVDTVDIEQQAARLQSRVRHELAYQNPKRNPFRFTVRPTPAVERPRLLEATATSPQEVPRDVVPFTLSGMATDSLEGRTDRTAIFTTPTEVLFAKQGDRVGQYTLTGIDDAGVELSTDDGVVRRLPLTP
jgi:hypothetical protein